MQHFSSLQWLSKKPLKPKLILCILLWKWKQESELWNWFFVQVLNLAHHQDIRKNGAMVHTFLTLELDGSYVVKFMFLLPINRTQFINGSRARVRGGPGWQLPGVPSYTRC
jgi:hypothetical protein